MKTRVRKWGNSLAVRIPKSFADHAGLEENRPVEMSVAEGALLIKPVAEHDFTLEELVRGITDENLHGEVDTGTSVGNEAW